MKMMKPALILAAAFAAFALPGAVSAAPYNLPTMNFDLWCQETQHLPPDRCDKRLPNDEADFEAYRTKVEKYEIPYMQGRETGQQLDRAILHNDPVDNPVTQNPAAASQSPTTPGATPQP